MSIYIRNYDLLLTEPIKCLVKDIGAIEPNPRRLSNINGLLKILLLILSCEYYNCLSYERQVLHVCVLH